MQIDFEKIQVPEEKLNQVVSDSLAAVHKEHRKKKYCLITTSAAACAVILLSVILISNPVLASKIPFIGSVFEKIQNSQRYSGNFNEVATSAEEFTEKTVCESNGYTMTLSEIYCDSEAMYISAILESETPFPAEAMTDSPGATTYENGNFQLFLNYTQAFDFMTPPAEYDSHEWPGEDYSWTPLTFSGEYEDEHTFIGSIRIDFNLYPIAMYETIPENFNWNIDIHSISYIPPESEIFCFAKGSWNFKAHITTAPNNTTVTEVNDYAPNGAGVSTLTLTPYEAQLELTRDETKIQPGYEEYDSIQFRILDANGTIVNDKCGLFSPANYDISELTIYYFPTPTDADYTEIQEQIKTKTDPVQLRDYLESIAIHKTVIHPELLKS